MVSLVFMKRVTDLPLESPTAISAPQEESPLTDTDEEAAVMRQARGRLPMFHLGGLKGISRQNALAP